ncbi:MAG: hypothetical protein FJ030_01740 [Chloroflexi bacterium]|nr:hypothetical protein [Chloroflexota bacterium]
MKLRLSLAVPVAVVSGVVTLLAFFIRVEPLTTVFPVLLQWAATLAAIALLAGIVNLMSVHIRKVSAFSAGWAYSAVLVIAFVFVIFMWLLGYAAAFAPDEPTRADVIKLSQESLNVAFQFVQTPVEASLSALLVVVMVLAGARLIRARRHWSAVLFILVSLFLLVSLAPLGPLSFAQGLRDLLIQPLAMGAARGILLGIALGAVATGLRVIIGVDHPYGD